MEIPWQTGQVTGGRLYCRKAPDKKSSYWGKFSDGTQIQVKEVPGYEAWYETRWRDDVGYVMKAYVETDLHPMVTFPYDTQRAVAYAIHHATPGGKSGADPRRNRAFGNNTTRDCANFVSQCLCAGGLPMMNGWSYPLPGIPEGWKKESKWKLTYSTCQKLLEKNRIAEVLDVTQTRQGDIIYTFDPKQPAGKQYTHVTLAVGDYEPDRGGCPICGHTQNQNGAERRGDFKQLKAGKVKVYRVNPMVTVDSAERPVKLPVEGSGGEPR